MNKKIALLLKIAISFVLLYLLFSNIDIGTFWGVVSSANYIIILIVFLLFISIQALSAIRWNIILKKDMDISFSHVISFYFIGMFFNNFLPTTIGGDIVKSYYLTKISGKGAASLASIFLDRYSGITAMTTIAAVSTLLGYSIIKGTIIIWLLLAFIGAFITISIILWIDLFHRWALQILTRVNLFRLNERIDRFYNALMAYKSSHSILLKVFLISFLVQGGYIIAYYLLSKAIGLEVGIGYFCLFIPLATVVAMLPISLSGLGIREGTFVFLFTKVGATPTEALTLSLLFFVIVVCASLIGGIAYIRTDTKMFKTV